MTKERELTNPAIAEDGIIISHPGIFGDDDLSQKRSWMGWSMN